MDASAYNMSFDKEQLSVLCANYDRRIDALAKENAKLRELVRELHQCSRQYGCDRCGYKDGCAMFGRMRELGVEVDE